MKIQTSEPRGILDFYGNPVYSVSNQKSLDDIRKAIYLKVGQSIACKTVGGVLD